MNSVKSIILSVAVASLVGGVIYILTPSGATQKTVRTAIFTFIICSSVSPYLLAGDGLEFMLPEIVYDNSQENILVERMTESMEGIVVSSIDKILKSSGINNAEIKIITDKNPDNSISIIETVITVPPEYISMTQEIKLRIKNQLGYDVRVTV